MYLEPLFQQIGKVQSRTEKIFIYGFGSYGRNLYQILKRNHISVDGFLVTRKPDQVDSYEVPVYEAFEFITCNVGYILALSQKNYEEVSQYLQKNGVDMGNVVNAGAYLEQFGEKRGMRVGSIEVTTVIGCKVNCKYCPQSLLLNRYFENDKNRISNMSMETFQKCLDFFPKEYDFSFGGMSEPFLNKHFLDMLKLACKRNRKVFLYTTLVGIKQEQVEEILSLPLQFVVIHVADKYQYAKIQKSEVYYQILEKFINAKKADGTPFVNMCNAQAEPDERVKEICFGKYEILTEMTDRAGNLNGAELIHNKVAYGKLSCGNLGPAMNNNVLLPDGSIVLCCMDYGLKHVLGNINVDTFEEISNGSEMRRVRSGMDGNENIDILCRSCSYARMRES